MGVDKVLYVTVIIRRGLRTLLIHMLVLCFIPHVALVAQNCTIMAQLSHVLDSSLFLHNKVYTALALGDAVVAVQRERVFMSRYLFDVTSREDIDLSALKQTFESTDSILEELPQAMGRDNDWLSLYHFREDVKNIIDLKKSGSFRRLSVYRDINRVLLIHIMKYVRFTTSTLWRHLSASYELLRSIEEISMATSTAIYITNRGLDLTLWNQFEKHRQLALEHLQDVVHFLEAEQLLTEMRELLGIMVFYEDTALQPLENISSLALNNTFDLLSYTQKSHRYMEKLVKVKTAYWDLIRELVRGEVWQSRRTLGVSIVILVTVLLASPLLILILRHTVNTIQVRAISE
ncbi:hypothetical protein evm_006796 [Chilo suppressalis]|nr:hypothetical protein evm_006796 [Chilo suppressalis]